MAIPIVPIAAAASLLSSGINLFGGARSRKAKRKEERMARERIRLLQEQLGREHRQEGIELEEDQAGLEGGLADERRRNLVASQAAQMREAAHGLKASTARSRELRRQAGIDTLGSITGALAAGSTLADYFQPAQLALPQANTYNPTTLSQLTKTPSGFYKIPWSR